MSARIAAAGAIAALLLTTACEREGLIWSGSRSFPGGRWKAGEKMAFMPDSTHLKGEKARALLSLRYAEDASMESFPVVVETENPADGTYTCDTLRLKLLKAEERLASHGKLGIFETTDTLAVAVTTLPGWYISIQPAVNEDITGLYSITLELENNNEK